MSENPIRNCDGCGNPVPEIRIAHVPDYEGAFLCVPTRAAEVVERDDDRRTVSLCGLDFCGGECLILWAKEKAAILDGTLHAMRTKLR